MSHVPVDHPLRPVYRLGAALAGVYVLAFGVLGLAQTGGGRLFAQTGLPWVLGLRTNRAFAIASIVAGIILLAAIIIGRNIDVRVNIAAATVFLTVGTLMLALMIGLCEVPRRCSTKFPTWR